MRSTFSTPLAADNGVSASTLLSGKYLTFSSVLVIYTVYLILETEQARAGPDGRRQPAPETSHDRKPSAAVGGLFCRQEPPRHRRHARTLRFGRQGPGRRRDASGISRHPR